MILLVIVLVLVFGLGGGYWGHAQWGANNAYAGPGIGLGGIFLALLFLYLLHVI